MKKRLIDILPSEEEAFNTAADLKDIDIKSWMKAYSWCIDVIKKRYYYEKRQNRI